MKYKVDIQREQRKPSDDSAPSSNCPWGHLLSTLSLVTWHILHHSDKLPFFPPEVSLRTKSILILKSSLSPHLISKGELLKIPLPLLLCLVAPSVLAAWTSVKSGLRDLPWHWSSVPHKLAALLSCSVSCTISLLFPNSKYFNRHYLTIPFYTWEEFERFLIQPPHLYRRRKWHQEKWVLWSHITFLKVSSAWAQHQWIKSVHGEASLQRGASFPFLIGDTTHKHTKCLRNPSEKKSYLNGLNPIFWKFKYKNLMLSNTYWSAVVFFRVYFGQLAPIDFSSCPNLTTSRGDILSFLPATVGRVRW